MTRKEYLNALEKASVSSDTVDCVEAVYGCKLSLEVKKVLSFSKDSVFFDDGWRTLSLAEILDAFTDLHIDFKSMGVVPMIDCGENDFIVYQAVNNSWAMFNIVDEVLFKKRTQLASFFK